MLQSFSVRCAFGVAFLDAGVQCTGFRSAFFLVPFLSESPVEGYRTAHGLLGYSGTPKLYDVEG